MANLIYLGRLSDLFGTGAEDCALPDDVTDTAALRSWLNNERALDDALLDTSIRIAINDEIVAEPFSVTDGDTIAFLPPVGGG